MNITIPLRMQPLASATPVAATGVRVSSTVGIGSGTVAAASARESAALRAIAAAASLADPQAALEIAKAEEDQPGTAIGSVNRDKLRPVLNAVARVQDDRSLAGTATDAQEAVAAVIGADAALVAAAFAEVEKKDPDVKSEARMNSLRFVAAYDFVLLERAARAATRETVLDMFPTQLSRLERIEERLDAIEQRVTALEGRVTAIESP